MSCHTGCRHGDHQEQGSCGDCCGGKQEIIICQQEAEFLMRLAQIPFLPVTRFLMKSSQSDHLESVALAPVYLEQPEESMEAVKETGKVLDALAQKRLIALDYDKPLQGGDYSVYKESGLFRYFQETVEEGSRQPNHLYDVAALECGSIALTAIGQQAVEQLEIEWQK